ncbi:MAG: hypothetical protein ACFWT2_15535 [Thermoanaerobacterium thermosaccharolyticum]|jgi:hypothetical protein
MNNNFKILQKTYDMILYGNICLKQFPKHEKHVMAADIRKSMYKLLELIVRANKKYYKKNHTTRHRHRTGSFKNLYKTCSRFKD